MTDSPSKRPGFTLWFTGLSGSGKSTLSAAVAERLRAEGLDVEVLDGDVLRESVSKGLGFSRKDRDENIRRVGLLCAYLTVTGRAALSACISPYRAQREQARQLIGPERFVEVFMDCPIQVLADRDVKGLYKKALAGEIKGFTGIDDPYEPPENPDVRVDSSRDSLDESVDRIVGALRQRGLLGAHSA